MLTRLFDLPGLNMNKRSERPPGSEPLAEQESQFVLRLPLVSAVWTSDAPYNYVCRNMRSWNRLVAYDVPDKFSLSSYPSIT